MNRTGRGLVLVVDRDRAARAFLSSYLRDIGYGAAEASSGASAARLVRGGLNTIAIVCDAGSFDDDLQGGAPVLMLTDSARPARGGADAVMSRPFQLVDFGDKVLRLIRDRAARA